MSPVKTSSSQNSHPTPANPPVAVIDAMNVRRDEINNLWRTAEEHLKAIGFHSTSQVVVEDYTSGQAYEEGEYEALAFVKLASGWRICVVRGDYREVDSEYFSSITPITDCPVDTRVYMARHLGKLKQQIYKDAEDCLPRLDAAINTLKSELKL